MEEKNSFVMYKSWLPAIKSMSDEQAGKLIKAVYEFSVNPNAEVEDPAIRFVFEIIKETIKKDSEKYAETKEKRKAAVKARWDKENDSIQNDTNDTNEYKCIEDIQKNTNDTVYVSESVSVSVSDNESVSVKDKKEKDSPTESRKSNPPKHKYGEYQHVMLSDRDLELLYQKHGEEETKAAIEYLDSWIEEKGYKSKNHKIAMERWVFDAVKKKGNVSNITSRASPKEDGYDWLGRQLKEGGMI